MERINLIQRNKSIKIALLGSYPPPYGGVSIHIQRIKEKLDELGISTIVYDFSGGGVKKDSNIVSVNKPLQWLVKYFFTAKENRIHSHFSDWRPRSIIGFMSFFNKKTIITIHGDSLKKSLENHNWLKKQIIKFSLKHSSYIIAMNTNIKELCLSIGVKPTRISVIPSFIPPTLRKNEINEIPREVWDFIDLHSPIISANAFEIRFHEHEDLYGIDMSIDLCSELIKDFPNLGLIFCLPRIGDYEYYEKLKKTILDRGIQDKFLFINKNFQFYPILMKSDIFVRPTNTDGDAVSIREALYFNVPVIASNCVQRPRDTIIFKNRDNEDFLLKVKTVLNNIEEYKKQIELKENYNNFEKVLEIYKNI